MEQQASPIKTPLLDGYCFRRHVIASKANSNCTSSLLQARILHPSEYLLVCPNKVLSSIQTASFFQHRLALLTSIKTAHLF
jgi:hypothetical protein